MALNIPNTDLPGNSFLKGIDTGSSMFSRLMQPVLEREKQKQQAEQFAQQQLLKKQQEARMANQFSQDLALRKQQESRLGANSGLNRQILEQNLTNMKHKNDPSWAMQQLQQKLNFLENMGKGSGQSKNGGQQPPVNLMDMINSGQEIPQGQGAMMPQEEPQKQQPMRPDQEQSQEPQGGNQLPGGISLEDVKRALTYQALGIKQPPNGVYHGAARDASDLAKLKKEVGENSEVYQNAKAAYDAQVDAKKDLRDLRARTKAGLKPGEKEFFDEQTGEPLGKEIPLTAKERESEEGNILFNELYPAVYKGASPFSGEGSITRLDKAFANYKNDPKSRKLVDDLLLSDKAMAATTVNEASTLKSGHTNQTYNRLKESLESQDVPKLIKKLYKQYKLPASAQLKAAMRYQKLLSDARQKARKGTPATQKLFYNPEMQAQHKAQINEGAPSENDPKSVIVIDPNGKKFETTEANASHLPKGWKRG